MKFEILLSNKTNKIKKPIPYHIPDKF